MARLAGVPAQVVERAKQILAQLENQALDSQGGARIAKRRRAGDLQLSLFAPQPHPLVEALTQLDLDGTTPLAALEWLARWKQQLPPGEGR